MWRRYMLPRPYVVSLRVAVTVSSLRVAGTCFVVVTCCRHVLPARALSSSRAVVMFYRHVLCRRHVLSSRIVGSVSQKLLQANFITEFGLHCGLPEVKDPTSEEILTGFLQRVRMGWGEDGVGMG